MLSLLLLVSVAAAPALPDSLARRVDSVFAAWNGTDRPGCALGIDRGGQPLHRRGYGMADLQHDLAITPASIFHVASVSKQFAAFSVALLAEEGRLSLDDDVRRYVPEVPDLGQRITIGQLIHHTSGLRDQWELLGMSGWRYPTDLITESDVLRITSRQRGLNFTPGTHYLYSNTGYTLLAVIVKRVSGQSLRDFADARIFRPLGMTQTHFHDDYSMIVRGRTSAYEPREGGGWRVSIPTFDTYGATSLFTTVDDLLRWQRNFDTGAVGGAALLRAGQQPVTLTGGRTLNYGYGLALGTYRGARTVGHGGADAGYRSDLLRFPEHGLSIAVLCNGSTTGPGQLSRQVADVLLGDRLAAPAAPPVTLTAERAEALAGLYRREGGAETLWLVARGARLTAPEMALGLNPTSDSTLQGAEFPVRFRFSRLGPATHRLTIEEDGRPSQAWRQLERAPPPSREVMATLAGDYRSDELEVRYVVALGDSGLTVQHRKSQPMPLRPVTADLWVAPFGTLRFVRERGRVTGFTMSGGRVLHVGFRRVS